MENTILDMLKENAEECIRRFGFEDPRTVAAWERYDKALDIYD